jgi:hypothetical protein
MNRSRRISRRTVLRGAGAAVGLPLLQAMLPSRVRAAGARAPLRMVFLYVPNGIHMPDWTPAETGDGWTVPPTLEPLAPHKSHVTVLSGLTLNGARAHGDGGGDHARSAAAFLTGAHPRKTDGADIRNDISVDQLAARELGGQTRLPSLELGLERSAQAGNCDSGYSCAYSSNLSWRSPTSPVAKEMDPSAVFDRLFAAAPQGDARRRRSVLDLVREDAHDLQRKLGQADRRKLEEYLHAVRDIERRMDRSAQPANRDAAQPDLTRPDGVPAEYEQHARLMFDLMTLALQTDATRILTFMFTNEGSNRSYPQIGVGDGHHDLSHHGNDAEKQRKISAINRHHMSLAAHFVDKLATTPDGDASLLDHVMLVYGSGIGDGNRHNHDNLPIVLVGRGGGTIDAGRHLAYPRETPLTNLYVSLLQRMGVAVSSFGDSTGPLEDLGPGA